MAILKSKDIKKMSASEIEEKIKQLKFELIKGSTTANRAQSKTKELKRALARLYTYNKFSKSLKEELKQT